MQQNTNLGNLSLLEDRLSPGIYKEYIEAGGFGKQGISSQILSIFKKLESEKPHIRIQAGYEFLTDATSKHQLEKLSEGVSRVGNYGHMIGHAFESMIAHELINNELPLITQASLFGIPSKFDGLLWNESMPVVLSLKTSLSSDRIKDIAWEAMVLKNWLLPNKFYAIFADPTGNVHNRINQYSGVSSVNPVCATAPEFDAFVYEIKLMHSKSPFLSSIKPIMPAEGRVGF